MYFNEKYNLLDVQQTNGGLYFVGDQKLNDKLSVFSQLGLSLRRINTINLYCSIGINYKSLIDKRPNDQPGLAVASAYIQNKTIGTETVIEMTYKLVLNSTIYIKPDIQYIINPAGISATLDNALIGLLRFGLEY